MHRAHAFVMGAILIAVAGSRGALRDLIAVRGGLVSGGTVGTGDAIRVYKGIPCIAPARFLARCMAARSAKAHLDHFVHAPPGAARRGLGATDGSEIAYVFVNLRAIHGARDRDVAAAMGNAWVRFARTGDPNGPGLPTWPAYTAATDAYMEFAAEPRVAKGLHREACDLVERAWARNANRLPGP